MTHSSPARPPRRFPILWTSLLLLLVHTLAFAQGSTTSSVSGVITDAGGGVIPGALVAVKNNATGAAFDAVSNGSGVFSVPALPAGTYTVTISLSGFKTVVIDNLILHAATPVEIRPRLEIGNMDETVTVVGGTQLVQTQSSAIAATIQVDQINSLPLPTRNTMNFAMLLPGVDTATVTRSSTFMGLPQSAINITIDGVNAQDNYSKTGDGFFTYTTPRQDSVEEVTVTSASAGGNAGAHGAVQVQFVTRSGSNVFQGSVYHYSRHPSINSNYYFNELNGLEKNRIILNQYGGRLGGPIVIPGLYNGRDRAFFFFNYEELRLPTSATRNRTVLSPLAQQGVFRYTVTSGGQTDTRQVDVLALAAAQGQVARFDPLVAALLAEIRSAAQTTGTLSAATDPNILRYVFQSSATRIERQPTTRIDFNLTPKHRLSGTYIWVRTFEDPNVINGLDAAFPNFPNHRSSLADRPAAAVALRSTLGSNIVNELRSGGGYGPTVFGREFTAQQFENQGGYALGFPLGTTSATVTTGSSSREVKHWMLENTVNWMLGKHNLNFGGTFMQFNVMSRSQTMVPSIAFGMDSRDPADSMFTTNNFPGASGSTLTDARALYAFLTGRVISITGNAQLDEATKKYVYLGQNTQRGRVNEFGVWLQDSWRATRTLTLNAGVRWRVEFPFSPRNDAFSTATYADLCGISGVGADGRCNFFRPGVLNGIRPQFMLYDRGSLGYNTDWNNIAPNVGAAWRPNAQGGIWRRILGDPEQATIRGGYAVAYNRNGIGDYVGFYGANPGGAITANRSLTLGNLLAPGQSLPQLLSDRSQLGPPAFSATRVYPIPGTTATSLSISDPNLQVSYTRSYTIGFQRALSPVMAVEVRFVGTRNLGGWTANNLNEVNIVENGFLSEFKQAQVNLQANIAAGRGNSLAYFGPGTGTAPLPIYLAYLTGSTLAGDPSKYTAASFSNTTFVNRLAVFNPNPNAAAATDLHGSATFRANALAAGLPVNFFVLNPDVSAANLRSSSAKARYNSLQVELRRRMSRGLFVTANYVLASRYEDALDSQRRERVWVKSTAGVRHALKMNWTYDIPVGRGKRFGGDMAKIVDVIAGGWNFSGTGRVQSGRVLSFRGVRLVGMTEKDLQKAYKIRKVDATKTLYILPQDIIDQSFKAFSVSATSPTGYGSLGPPSGRYFAPVNGPGCIDVVAGDCGPRDVFVTGPLFSRFDFSVKKKFLLTKRVSAQLQIDLLNVFDAVNFIPVAGDPLSTTFGQVTAGYTDPTYTYDPGGRLGQISWRVSW